MRVGEEKGEGRREGRTCVLFLFSSLSSALGQGGGECVNRRRREIKGNRYKGGNEETGGEGVSVSSTRTTKVYELHFEIWWVMHERKGDGGVEGGREGGREGCYISDSQGLSLHTQTLRAPALKIQKL